MCENHSALAKIILCLDKRQLSIFLFADYAFDFFNVLWEALLDREGLAEDFIALKRPLANLNSICSLNRSHGCLLPSPCDFLLLLSAIGKNHARLLNLVIPVCHSLFKRLPILITVESILFTSLFITSLSKLLYALRRQVVGK